MGMFDWVKCEVELPDGFKSDSFQTKDMENLLCTYTITKEGRLIKTCPEWYIEEELPEIKEDTNFHGMFRFYGYEKGEKINDENFKFVWHEYNAKFTNGNLVSITKVEEVENGTK